MNWMAILKRERRIMGDPRKKGKKSSSPPKGFEMPPPPIVSRKELHERFREKLHEFAKMHIENAFERDRKDRLEQAELNLEGLKNDKYGQFTEEDIKSNERYIEWLKSTTPEEILSNAIPMLDEKYDKLFNRYEDRQPHEYYMDAYDSGIVHRDAYHVMWR